MRSTRRMPVWVSILASATAAGLLMVVGCALDKPENAKLRDLNWREVTVMGTLTVMILWLGLYPAPVLRRTQGSVEQFVHQVENGMMQVPGRGRRR